MDYAPGDTAQLADDARATLDKSIFLALFDQSPDAILVARSNGQIIEASIQAETNSKVVFQREHKQDLDENDHHTCGSSP